MHLKRVVVFRLPSELPFYGLNLCISFGLGECVNLGICLTCLWAAEDEEGNVQRGSYSWRPTPHVRGQTSRWLWLREPELAFPLF